MYREIKETVIADQVIQYRELGILQVFEFLNILEENLYTKTELEKVKTMGNAEERIQKLHEKFKAFGESSKNAAELDFKILLNRNSRDNLFSVLNKFYVDVDIEKVESKVFISLYSFLAEKLFSADVMNLIT